LAALARGARLLMVEADLKIISPALRGQPAK
jgi:hypothetical protein